MRKSVPNRASIVGCLVLLCATTSRAAGWEVVACENECTARHEAAMTALNGKLYLLGGRGLKSVEEYDPASNRWRQLSKTPMQLHHFQAVPVGNRIALVGAMTGGYPKEPAVPNVWWYEPARDEWTQGAAMPAGRERGGAGAVLHEDKIYLIGGNTNGHWNGFVAWADVLDLKTGQWTALPDAPHARDHFQAALVDGKIVAAGGRRTYAETKQTFDLTVPEVDVYDIAAGKWTTLAEKIPTPRAGCMAASRDGLVTITGGESAGQKDAHNEVEALTLATGRWRSLPSLNQGRHGSGTPFIGDTMYVAAGCKQKGGGAEISSMEKLVWPVTAK